MTGSVSISARGGRTARHARPTRWSRLEPVLLWVVLAFAIPTAHAELVAERITAENFAERHVAGPDADGGIGDWFLGNGTLCAVISDPAHESPLAPQGGVLIDLGHCDRANDQWAVLQPLLNLSQSHVVPVSEIEAGEDASRAWIRTRALFAGIEIVTTYAVDEASPTSLDVSVRARRIAEGEWLFTIGSVLLHPTGQTRPFSLLRRDLAQSRGFAYPGSDRRSLLSLLNAIGASDLTVLVGGDEMPPVSYGVETVAHRLVTDEGSTTLAAFSITGLHFTSLNALTLPFWFGGAEDPLGLLALLQIPFMDIAEKSRFESDVRLWIGDRADVASITDQLWTDAPRITGRVDDPTARLHLDLVSGAPVTEVRPDAEGAFTFRLPPNRYVGRVVAPAGRETSFDLDVSAEDDEIVLPPIELGAPGWVRLPEHFIGRLLFLATDGSGPVWFGDDLLGFRIGDDPIPTGVGAPFVNLAGSAVDSDRLPLPPGAYRVVAIRGPEYAAAETRIEVSAGRVTALELAPLERVVATPDWISADLHVHSGESFDSSLPQTRQIVAFAASGAEVLVAAEHDRVFDPRPAIEKTGLGDQLVSITGVEVTSAFEGGDTPFSTGHLNAFPIEPVPNAYRGGAPMIEGRRLRDALADMRALPSPPFVQLNHPRPRPGDSVDDNYFEHLGIVGEPFEPTRPLDQAPNSVLVDASPRHGGRDLDYHGVELMNGEDRTRYRRARADWFSLLLQGEIIVGTANSDSHRLGVIVGLPRTYVAAEKSGPGTFDEGAFMAALRGGRAFGTTGPVVGIRLNETGIGGLHRGTTGTLHVSVDAAPWVPVSEWRAYVNGELVHRAAIRAGETASLPLAFARDAFVTVEVEGPAEGVYREALPEFTPFAFTNPIFVDADGNDRYDAPGLPETLPISLTDPDASI